MRAGDKFHHAHAAVAAAERAMHAAVVECFPVGSSVDYAWHGKPTWGIVVRHGLFGRVYVRSAFGSSYWIRPDHIAGARA